MLSMEGRWFGDEEIGLLVYEVSSTQTHRLMGTGSHDRIHFINRSNRSVDSLILFLAPTYFLKTPIFLQLTSSSFSLLSTLQLR